MNKSKVNIHGQKLCDYMGCRKHTNLKETNDGTYCKGHLDVPKRNYTSSPHLSLYNSRGKRLCDAFGCQSIDIERYRGGLFCVEHCLRLEEIRSKINHINSEEEFFARLDEINFRKRTNKLHWNCASSLEKIFTRI